MKYPTEPRRLTETRLEWQTQPGLVQVQGRGRRKHHQAKRWHRSKRSISTPRHVEVLVVADTTMMAFHQDGDVETYLLTIMNMVSALYLDPTIGNFINIVVVRIILVEEEEAEVPTLRLKSLLLVFNERDKRAMIVSRLLESDYSKLTISVPARAGHRDKRGQNSIQFLQMAAEIESRR